MSNIKISQLAKYGLDYASLVSRDSYGSKNHETGPISQDALRIEDFIYDDTSSNAQIELITDVEPILQSMPDLEEEEIAKLKSRVAHDRKLLEKLQKIDATIKTSGYTKRVVIKTGFVSFEAKDIRDENENYTAHSQHLIQIPISAIFFNFRPGQNNCRNRIHRRPHRGRTITPKKLS